MFRVPEDFGGASWSDSGDAPRVRRIGQTHAHESASSLAATKRLMRHTSETELQCNCGWFDTAAAQPSHPIEYDALTNEHPLVPQHPKGRVYARLRYCPWCGCKAPKSLDGSLFPTRPTPSVFA